MGSMKHGIVTLREMWRLQDAHQFKQIHALPSGLFLLSGGFDAPTLPQSRTACSIGVIDPRQSTFIWKETQFGNKPFDYSCFTTTQAIGVIPNRFKTDFSGLMRFDLATGQRLQKDVPANGVQGVAPLGGESVVYALWEGRSSLVAVSGYTHSVQELSEDRLFRIAGLTAYDDQHFVSTMERTYAKNGKGAVEYVHQLRTHEGRVVWEHSTRNESITVSPGRDFIFTYPNAGPDSPSRIEAIEAKSGIELDSWRVPSSLANLVALSSTVVLYCDPSYRLCVYDLRRGENVVRCSFPSDCPGWLAISVDHHHRTILACKANNFMAPMSTIAAFGYDVSEIAS